MTFHLPLEPSTTLVLVEEAAIDGFERPTPLMAQITFKLPERIVPWPGNKPEPEITTREMFAKLVCNPPLGQATVIPPDAGSVTFSVLLEVDAASQKQWQIALWHDLGGPDDEWKAADFQEASADQELVCYTSILGFRPYSNITSATCRVLDFAQSKSATSIYLGSSWKTK